MRSSADDDKTTPAMRQWREMKALHPEKLLLFRMGDFYEMFHADAVEASRLLGLALTRRNRDAAAPPLAGIPHHQLDRYVKELMDKGRSVAICDQLEDPAQAKGVVKRGITRVITPGTVVDDDILPPSGNNYLAAVALHEKVAALAMADLSTGDFFIALPEAAALADLFARFAPAETLAPRETTLDPTHPIGKAIASGVAGGITRRDSYLFDPREGETLLKAHFGVVSLAPYHIEHIPAALGAAGAILGYFKENQSGSVFHLKPPRILDDSGTLRIDRNTIRNLELVSPSRDRSGRPTLLSIIDKTLTGPGGRLVRN
ncbi:MAG: DNA mismatch repair protein MutS, partial [Planctomycetes bacterium]|nr:DNA mismatch repair protein MutS [Planctomycetota bacterium]